MQYSGSVRLFFARTRSRHLPPRSCDGFTLIEVIIVAGLIAVLASFALPSLLRARTNGRETAAVAALRAVNDAQASYASVCGGGAFAVLLPTLAVPPPGSQAGFLSPDLTSDASPIKSGYQFSLTAGAEGKDGPADCHGMPTNTAYYVSAAPVEFSAHGGRAFASSQERGIWQDTTGVPPTEPFTASATVTELP